MDSITHGVSGAVAALAFAPPEWQAPATAALTLSALAPDIDLLYLLKGRTAFLKYHRGWTHSLASAAVFAPGLGGALYFAYPDRGFWALTALSFAGVILHILFDIITIWGAEFVWPFTRTKYAWSLVPSGNLPFVGSLALALIGALVFPEYRQIMAGAGLAMCGSLILVAALTKPVARTRSERLLAERGLSAHIREIFPARHTPGAWLVVAEGDDTVYSVAVNVWRSPARAVLHSLAKAPVNPFIEAAHRLEEAATYSNIVTFPIVSYEQLADRHRVVFTSLRDELRVRTRGTDRTRIIKGLVVEFDGNTTILSASLLGAATR